MTDRVELCFRGRLIERLLSRALEAGVQFDRVAHDGKQGVKLWTTEAGAARLIQMAQQYSLDVRVVKPSFGRVLAARIRARPALLPGVLAMVALVFLFSTRVWLIDVHPGEEDETGGQALRDALDALGVTVGMRASALDLKELSTALQAETGHYAYVGARLQGVRLLIEAAHELPEPELYQAAAARDLVASCDAILTELNVLSGTAAATPGDAVRKGQVLIRGEEKLTDELTRGVCALGNAEGRVYLKGEVSLPMYEARLVPTGREREEKHLKFFELERPLSVCEPFECERVETEKLPLVGYPLPLHRVTRTHIELESQLFQLDEAQVYREAGEKAMEKAYLNLPKNAEIVDKWIDYSMIEGESISARATVVAVVQLLTVRGT